MPKLTRRVFLAATVAWPGIARGDGAHPGLMVDEAVTIHGRTFIRIPDDEYQPYNVTLKSPPGKTGEWYRIEARQGDNNRGETRGERVGLDGWPQSLKQQIVDEFSVVFDEAAISRKPDDWWQIYELHAKKHPEFPREFEGAGPLAMAMLWSGGRNEPRFRIVRKHVDAGSLATARHGDADLTVTIVYDSPALTPGVQYDFVMDIRQNTPGLQDGHLKIWMGVEDGEKKLIVDDHAIYFGYGIDRKLYSQFRIYRNTRPYPAVAYFRINGLADSNTK